MYNTYNYMEYMSICVYSYHMYIYFLSCEKEIVIAYLDCQSDGS